jgi:L-histidine Nalpha-methyltransferase
MHLRSRCRQTVDVRKAGLSVTFKKDETIWTESCHKYKGEEVVGMAERTGFLSKAQWVDREWPFAQSLLIAKEEPG